MSTPPSPDEQEQRLIAAFAAAEAALLLGVARILRTTTDPDVILYRVRRLVRIIGGALDWTIPAAADLVRAAARSGAGSPPPPGSTMVHAPRPRFEPRTHAERAAAAIVLDLTSELEDVRFRITRLPDDIYKVITPHGATVQVLDNPITPAHAQAAAWRALVNRGVHGFTDRSGRDWALSSYVEMAVRTATTRAFNAARLDEIQSFGGNLVFVTDDGHPCPLCLPWQNRVLAIRPDGVHPTVHDATVAGLFHPNCKHQLAEYTANRTRLGPVQTWNQELDAMYKATQRQRALERDIRKAKRQFDYALTPTARADARLQIRKAQAHMRQFLAETDLMRHSRREQVEFSNQKIKLPTLTQ